VEPFRLNPSVQQIAEKITERTRAIICQHTYGIAQPVQEIAALRSDRQIILIEDCCQMVSRDSHLGGVATTGDASFFSTQWSKPFSTGLGGMAVFCNSDLHTKCRDILATFSKEQNRRRARSLAAQMLLYNLTVRPKTKTLIAGIYRWAQRKNIVQGTTLPKEYGFDMPADYPAGAVNIQAVLAIKQLRQWRQNVEHRRMLTEFYLKHLPELGVDVAPLKVGAEKPALWAIPLFVENVSQILSRTGRLGLPIASWFGHPPVHIVLPTAKHYDYCPGQCPRSEWMVAREIHLLTSPEVTVKQAGDAIKLIKQYGRIANY
jgi:dTDP-4-amino-4,6-dideoxygalactose transaminase